MQRAISGLAWVTFASIALAQNTPPGPPPVMEKVKSDIYLIHNQKADFAGIMNFGGNIAVYLTDEGVILVDSKFESMHDDTVAKVRSSRTNRSAT
jgi:hypothetical protein